MTNNLYAYIPIYSLTVSRDVAEKVSKEGFEFLRGLSIIATPDIVRTYYSTVLTEEYIRIGYSRRTKAKVVSVALCPDYCLVIDQSREFSLPLDWLFLTFLRMLRLSNVNFRYWLLFDENAKAVIFHSSYDPVFVQVPVIDPVALYNRSDLHCISNMLKTCLQHDIHTPQTYMATKINAALELFRQSLLHEDFFLRTVFYAVALECLFSPGIHELAHQISENTAFFLATADEDKRLSLYRTMRQFYRLRSELIHTGKTKMSYDTIAKLLSVARDAVAKSIVKCLTSSELVSIFSNDRKRKQYLEDLVIGRSK